MEPDVADLLRRLVRRAERDVALAVHRARHPSARFGSGCDIRRGLHVTFGPTGRLEVGADCVLDRHLTLEVIGSMSFGAGTIFGHHCTVGAKQSVVIGENCLIAEMVSIRDNDHVFSDPLVPYKIQGHSCEPVVLGDNVWLGTRVVVTKGVSIGSGAVVGAGSVVTSDIPAGAIFAGVPARLIRQR